MHYSLNKYWPLFMPRPTQRYLRKGRKGNGPYPDFSRPKVQKRFFKEGRGQGRLNNYIPFLKVYDFPSWSFVHRIKGWKTARIHHLLSNIELRYFLILEYSKYVIDVREQFPLPLNETLDIAKRLGIKPPLGWKSKMPLIMTSDFVIEVRTQSGLTVIVVRSVKSSAALDNPRARELLEIERTYWSERGIDWGLVTEKQISKLLARNISFFHGYYWTDILPAETIQALPEIEELIFQFVLDEPLSPFAKVMQRVDKKLGLDIGSSLAAANHLIARSRLPIDMSSKLNFDYPIIFIKNT